MGDTLISISARKQSLRAVSLQRRRALPASLRRRCARRAAAVLLRWRPLRRARHVAVYLAQGAELDTTPLLRALARLGKRVYLPAVRRGGVMHFVPYRPDTRLRRGMLGVRHPAVTRPCRPPRQLDLVLLPLLAFDDRGHRLGRGGGYYDRALRRCGSGPKRVGYAYAVQRQASIPTEPWDLPLHVVVTENGLRACR